MKNYLPKDYHAHANNVGICQDTEGKLFVANANGVLIFDGFNWQLKASQDELAVYAILHSSDHKIHYALENNDFGIFEKKINGNYVFTSLYANLKPSEQPQEAIKQIVECNGGIYFLSPDKLIEYKNNTFKVYIPTNKFHIRSLKIGSHLFFTDLDNQLLVLDDGVLKSVKNTQGIANHKSYFSYKLSNTTFAIGCRDVGIYKAIYDSINPTNTIFQNTTLACNTELIASEINNGSQLNDGNLMVSSNKKGAFMLNTKLEIIKRFNTKTGLYENNIKDIFQDANGNVWLPNYYGISYIELNSPLLKYGRENNISGLVAASCYYNNKLYIATDKGLQCFNTEINAFEDVLNFNKQTWFLLTYNQLLFICTTKGIFVYNGKTITQINEQSTRYLLHDPNQPNFIFASTDNGFNIYQLQGKEFTLIKEYNLGHEVKTIATDDTKNIYFSTETNGIYFLNYAKAYTLDSIKKTQGLPNEKYENYVFNYKHNLLIGTENGLYRLIKKNDKELTCKQDPLFYNLTKHTEIFRAIEINEDIFCSQTIKLDNLDKYETQYTYLKNNKGEISEDKSGLSKLKGVKTNLITYDSLNHVVMLSADEGLYIINKQNYLITKTYHLFLHSIFNNLDTLLTNAISTTNISTYNLQIPYANNNLDFKFGYTCYENPDIIEFNYYLEGKDKGYATWVKKSEALYSNLFEGDYVLHVKTRNEISNQSIEMHIPFIVLAPWYRSLWAYIGYLVLFMALLLFIIKLNSKRLVSQNIKLEGVIQQRTAVIEEQKALVETKHQEIRDSINYAERIQRAMLASKKILDDNLNFSNIEQNDDSLNYFIFFKPKDIVSGDFYWANKLASDKFCLVTADSTGHGVPGAIMSMLNMNSLKEAVIRNHVEPSDILNYTRQLIIETLTNDGSESGGKDGMDCICTVFDFTKHTMTWAASNNPIYIVRENNNNKIDKENNTLLIELKPQKMPVGRHDKQYESFTQQIFQLEKGDMIYMITDGFADQFGGINGKKFMSKNLKNLLQKNHYLPVTEQKRVLASTFNQWLGNLEQIDDVTIIGIRV